LIGGKTSETERRRPHNAKLLIGDKRAKRHMASSQAKKEDQGSRKIEKAKEIRLDPKILENYGIKNLGPLHNNKKRDEEEEKGKVLHR